MAKTRKRKREEMEKNKNQGNPNTAEETEKRGEQEKIHLPNPISDDATENRGENRGEQEKNDLPNPIASDETEKKGEQEEKDLQNPIASVETEKRGEQEKDLPNPIASDETEKRGEQEKKNLANPERTPANENEFRLQKIVEEFVSSTAEEYKFEEPMTKRERKLVDHISRRMGLAMNGYWCGEKLIYTLKRKRNKAEKKAKKKEAEEAKKKEAEEAKKMEGEEASKKEADEASKKEAEEPSKKEAEEASMKLAEEARKKLAEEASMKLAEEARKKLAEEASKKLAEEASKKLAEEASIKLAEEARKKLAEEARKKLAEEAGKKLAEEARKKLAEEARKKWAEEASKKEAEEASKKLAEEARKEEAEEAGKKEGEEAKKEGKEARKNACKEARKNAYKETRKKGIESKKKFYRARNTKIQWKKKRNINPTPLTFSEEAKVVLQDLFLRHPPVDRELEKKNMIGNHGEKTRKITHGRDSMFCKPSMGKAEITKKLEKLNSRRVQDAKLRQISEAAAKLPIASFRDVITSKTESHQVVLISGETGCGKTTQVPQYILDHMWSKGESCKILCTQPRRISATSVAERISAERGEPIGNDVGYKIRLESKGGKHSSIIFMTNGVLLRVLVSKENARLKNEASKSFVEDDVSDITYIIVDEIHERDRYSDIMLAILRDMLPSHPHLRLILMSATLDAGRFSDYFGGCPVISVPGFTYPVKNFYLEDVLSIVKSAENKHLESAMLTIPLQNQKFTKKDKVALDESINLAWSNGEFDPLLEFISSEGSAKSFNYQHSSTGLTPLMVFAEKGRVGDVCMLLSFGVDCTLQAKDGTTALELAERENQQEAADVIKRHVKGSSVDEQRLLDTYLSSVNPRFTDVVLIEMLLNKICNCTNEGAILVFLPGWDDINKIRDKLLLNPTFKDESKFMILPLHSRVPSTEQKKVFQRPPVGCRKIVLSTNMAETSVTIDDIVYVLDTGRMKEKSYDPNNNVSTLQTSWISKASAKQRAGRAGRCQPGICYHLYSKLQASSLSDYQVPEIQRVSLDELCLQVKMLNPNFKIADFLQKTLDPPIPKTISNAIGVLQDVGALTSDESLTEFGEKLASFPVHPLKCRMLLFAILMNCLDPALTLACASDSKDPFTLPMSPDEKEKAARCKYELASLYGGQSDQLAVIAAFDCWRIAKERGQEKEFCSRFFISRNTMRLLGSMRMKLLQELVRCGFIPGDPKSCSLNVGDPGILHAVLVAGLYPKVGRLRPPRLIEIANGEVVRLHPQSTNFRLASQTNDDRPFVLFDEIIRSDSGMLIRSCTVVGPLPLLLFATDIVVFPGNALNDDHSAKEDIKEDGMEIDGENDDKIMSSPDNSVKVVVDNWLPFKSTAIDLAQIYCLRERLEAAILFKVLNPQEVIPPVLEASMYALARFLSSDGLRGIAQPLDPQKSTQNAAMKDKSLPVTTGTDPLDPVNAPTSTGNTTETDKSVPVTTLVPENGPTSSGNATETDKSVPVTTLDPMNGPTSSANATEIDKSLSVTTGSDPMEPVKTSTVNTTEIAKSSQGKTGIGQTPSDATEIDKTSLQDKEPGPRDFLAWLLTPITSQTDEMMIDYDPGETSKSPAPKHNWNPAGKSPSSAKYPNQKPHAKSPRFVGHGSGRSQNYPSHYHHHKNTRPSYDIAVKESDPDQSAKSPASKASKTKQKTPAKIPTLVGYGSTRYGPYGPRGGATKQPRKGGSRW